MGETKRFGSSLLLYHAPPLKQTAAASCRSVGVFKNPDWLVNSSNDSSYTCCTCTLVVYSPSLVLTRIKNPTAPPSPLPQGQRPYFPPMQYPRPNQWGGAPGVGGTTRPYGQSGYGRGGRGGGRMGGVSRGVS